MGRFSPDNHIEEQAFERQRKVCALCGGKMIWENYSAGQKGAWHAHHIDGNPDNNTLGNCAALHIPCHLEAHAGHYGGEVVLSKTEFPFLKGAPGKSAVAKGKLGKNACGDCGRTFKTASGLKWHLENSCLSEAGKGVQNCKRCGKRFRTANGLAWHQEYNPSCG